MLWVIWKGLSGAIWKTPRRPPTKHFDKPYYTKLIQMMHCTHAVSMKVKKNVKLNKLKK